MGCEAESEYLPKHDIVIALVCQYTGWVRHEHPHQWHTAPRWVEDPRATKDAPDRLCNLGFLENLADLNVEDIPRILASCLPHENRLEVKVVSEESYPLFLIVEKGTMAWKFLEKRLELGI